MEELAKSGNHLYIKCFWSILIAGIILLFPQQLHAQEASDTLSNNIVNRVIKRMSSLTLRAQFGTELNTGYKFKEHNGDLYEEGTTQEVFKARMALNVPVVKTKFISLSISPYYANYHLKFNRKEILSESLIMDMNGVHNMWGASANGTFQTKLLGKQVMGNANFAMEGSEYGIERFSGMVVAVVQIKQTRSTSIGIGALWLINTSSTIPIFPVFTLRHKFNEKLSLDLMMPMLHLNYDFNKNNRLSVGMSIDNDHFYIHPGKESLPEVCLYSKSVMTPELVYERTICKQLRLTVRGGAAVSMASRIYNVNNYKEYVEVSQPIGAFLNVGFSYSMFKK